MAKSYQKIINLVENGDPVDSSINAIFGSIAGNTDYLKDRLDALAEGKTVIAREVTVDTAVKVGQPVYFDSVTQSFKRAIARSTITTDATISIDVASNVFGVCYYKHNSTKADIILFGWVDLDVTQSISDTVAGVYYLSGTDAGKLVRQPSNISVPVLYWDGVSKVFINPIFTNTGADHQHYKFKLQPVTAGTHAVPLPGGHHSISAENTSIEGWLPADSTVFSGKAPVGAYFGYNILQSDIANLWPPLPLSGTTLSWNRPTTTTVENVNLPGELIISENFVINQTFTDGSITTINKVLTDPPTISAAIIAINNSLFEAAGLTVREIGLIAANTVEFKVVNNTGSAQTINGTLTIKAYTIHTVAVNTFNDFKEDTVPDSLVTLNSDGIWWMSDCYALVPWPVSYGTPDPALATSLTILTNQTGAVTRRETNNTKVSAIAYGEIVSGYLGMSCDEENGYLYVADSNLKKVLRFNTNEVQQGSTVVWTATGGVSPYDVAIDASNQTLYISDSGLGRILSFDLTTETLTVLVSGLTGVRGIALDLDNNFIYFAAGSIIKRCDMDGSNVTNIVTGLNTPTFVATNPIGNHLYWTDTGTDLLQRSTLAGASITTILTGQGSVGFALDLTNSKIYYTTTGNTIKHCSLTGTSITTLTTLTASGSLKSLVLATLPAVNSAVCGGLEMELTLWFSRMRYQTAETVVTSLRAAENSGLKITCLQDASKTSAVGDLEIDFDTELLVSENTNTAGHIVFKELSNKKFYTGPVVEAIISNDSAVTVSSTAQSGSKHQGVVTISFNTTAVNSELPVEEVRLNNVLEENYEDVLGLNFPKDVVAEYRAKVNIPANITATTLDVVLRFTFLVRANGDLPALTLTTRVLPRAGQTSASAQALVTADSAATLNVAAATGLLEDEYIELESSIISVTPGAILYFTLTRNGDVDGFSGDVHVIDQRGVISAIHS